MLSDPQIHYLDNAATTRVDPAVTEVIHDALVELWANPSSLYTQFSHKMRKTPNFSGVSFSRLLGAISERIGAVFIFRTFDRECAVFI